MTAVCLVSGGLDSAVAATVVQRAGEVSLGLTVRYGQRAAAREVEAARRICEALGIAHRIVEAPWLGEGCGSALVESGGRLPRPSPGELDGEPARASAAAVWVPNRNGVLVNLAAAFAERLGADTVVTGFNLEEAATFPDNSLEFLEAATRALALSTRNGVRVESPVAGLTKDGILRLAREIEAPVAHVWPCYEGGEEICGTCESCRRFLRALDRTGLASWWRGLRGAGAGGGSRR